MSFISAAVNKARHLAAQPIGWGAEATGAALSLGGLAPNKTAQRATGIGHAITNPNQVYTGAINPLNPNFGRAGGGRNWATVATPRPSAPTAPVDGGGQVQGASAVASNGVYGGDGSYDPNTDPSKVAAAREQVTGLMGRFRQAFDAVMGKIDALAAEKRQQLGQNYDLQKQGLQQTYGNTSQGIDSAEAARGTFNSSYRAGQQGTALDAFNQAYGGLNRNEAQDIAGVGGWANTAKSQAVAATPTYNPNDYNNVSDLLNIKQAVDSAIGQLGVSGASLGTTAANTAALNKITPTQETGSATLQSQLAKLAGTTADPTAKRAIATQMINDSGADPNTFLDYYDRIAQQTGSMA